MPAERVVIHREAGVGEGRPDDLVVRNEDCALTREVTLLALVYMGIAGDTDCNGPYGSANNATRSKALTQLFIDQGQGLFWDLCQGNLEMAFQTAISTIVDDTCQGFEPPG